MLTHKRLMELAAQAASPEHQAEIAALDALIKSIDEHYKQLEAEFKRQGMWFSSRIGKLPRRIADVPESESEDYPAAAR